jgi:Dolichyl-phosphate-mannose-protein mannosyltransferase
MQRSCRVKSIWGMSIWSVLLTAILIAACALRLAEIEWGLPFRLNIDEMNQVILPLRIFRDGKFNTGFFNYGHFIIYLIYGYFSLLHFFGLIGNPAVSAYNAEYNLLEDYTEFYLAVRLLVLLFGMATVVLTYLLACRWNKTAALIAAALLAFNPLHIKFSRLATVDVPLVFFIILVFYLSVLAVERKNKKIYYAGCVFTGLAFTTKYPGGIAMVAVIAAGLALAGMFDRGLDWRAKARLLWTPHLIFGGVIVLLVILLSSPYLLIDFAEFKKDLLYELWHSETRHLGMQEYGLSWIHHLKYNMIKNLGWPGMIASASGFFLAARSVGMFRALAVFTAIIFLLFGANGNPFERYMLPLFPFTSILIGIMMSELPTIAINRFGKSVKAIAYVFAAVVVLLIVYRSVGLGINQIRTLRAGDTRIEAYLWIQENLPANSKIAYEDFCPQLMPPRQKVLKNMERSCKECRRHFAVFSSDDNYKGFDGGDYGWKGVGVNSGKAYFTMGIEYICMNDQLSGRRVRDTRSGPDYAANITSFENYYVLLKQFEHGTGSGPLITLFQRKKE